MANQSLTMKMKSWIEKLTKDLVDKESYVLNKLGDFPGNKQIVKYALQDITKLPVQSEVGKEVVNFLEWYSTGKITGIKVDVNESRSE